MSSHSFPLVALAAALCLEVGGISNAAEFQFPVERTRVAAGESHVLAFRAKPAEGRQSPPLLVEPEGAIEVLEPPLVLPGESLGFFRIRPRGNALLRIGNASLQLDVTPRAPDVLSPRIVSPSEGAYGWGRIKVGVEMKVPPQFRREPVTLRLPDGSRLLPVSVHQTSLVRVYAFEVDLDPFPPGPLVLQVVALAEDGVEHLGEPATVTVMQPDSETLLGGVCAEKNDGPRPARWGEKPAKVVKEPNAPVPSVIDNSGPRPPWCLTVEIARAGYYQMILEAKGTYAAGAFPSVGLHIGENDRPVTVSRIADDDWGRTPIGRPIYLAKGTHVLTPYFLNDFSARGLDRNLFLARYELARVPVDGAGTGRQASASSRTGAVIEQGASMMANSPMMMQTTSPEMRDSGSSEGRSGNAPFAEPESGTPLDSEVPLIAFRDIFDGESIAGPVVVRANTWAKDMRKSCPKVELLVNGTPVQVQQGKELRFEIPVGAFREGVNRLRLRTRGPDGREILSTEQRLVLPVTPSRAPPPRFLRFTALDERWDDASMERFDDEDGGKISFPSNAESVLTLPTDLEGRFRVKLEMRGDAFEGDPIVEVVLRAPGQPEKVLTRCAVHGWRTVDAKEAELARGPKEIGVRFTNDHYVPKDEAKGVAGGDRNLHLKALQLVEIVPGTPVSEPRLHVAYPAPGAKVCGVDAVVVDYFSEAGCEAIDLVVDGNPQKLQMRPPNGIGHVVLPLLARSLSPGRHKLRVVAKDLQKRISEAPEIEFEVITSSPSMAGKYSRAVHLLNRFGYGPEPRQLAELLTSDETEWLRAQLDETISSPALQATEEAMRVAFPDFRNDGLAVHRVLAQLLRTTNPVRARLLLWTENHFSTWISKVGPRRQWVQHQRFYEKGPATFGELLRISATSPAMLVYLDQRQNFSDRLNENYAREIMELHTVGVDAGYDQKDVTELARLLNGWTLAEVADPTGLEPAADGEFRFEPFLNDGRSRRIFGMEFSATPPEDRYDNAAKALEMLSAHPSTARFISRKLVEHYVGLPADEKLVDRMSKVYLETGGDLREILVALGQDPAFWESAPRATPPQDFALRFSRMLGSVSTRKVNDFLNRSGMGLFQRASPDGYPEADSNYVNSNTLMQQWAFTDGFRGDLERLIPEAWRPAKGEVLARAQIQRLVDLIAIRLTGNLLSEASNKAAIEYFERVRKNQPGDILLLASFIAKTPELSLR